VLAGPLAFSRIDDYTIDPVAGTVTLREGQRRCGCRRLKLGAENSTRAIAELSARATPALASM